MEQTNTIEYAISEFREDLTIENTPIKLEIRGEVYEQPIFPATNNISAIHTWIVLVQHFDGKEFESGHEYFEGKMDYSDLEQRVKQLLENPFERMYPPFAEKYDINKSKSN